MRFKCMNENDTWDGIITKEIIHSEYQEIMIESRSSIMMVLGKTSRGRFACFPDFRVGCHLVDYRDLFWNTEQLTEILGKVDGITAASAIFSLKDTIGI